MKALLKQHYNSSIKLHLRKSIVQPCEDTKHYWIIIHLKMVKTVKIKINDIATC